MKLDTTISLFLNGSTGKSPIFDSTVFFLASYLPYLIGITFLVWLLISSFAKKEKVIIFLTGMISAIISRFGVTEFIRLFYHRARPFVNDLIHPLFLNDNWSFPSGHSAFFFALSTAVFLYNKKWGVGFFIATCLMTLNRVIAGVHYPTDILGGMIIGISVAYLIFSLQKKLLGGLASK